MSPNVVVRATRPFRAFFNQRFDDVQRRLQSTEERLEEVLEQMQRQTADMAEMQRALLDSITLLGAVVAERDAERVGGGSKPSDRVTASAVRSERATAR